MLEEGQGDGEGSKGLEDMLARHPLFVGRASIIISK